MTAVLCQNRAELCCCHLPDGHDGPHECQDANCGGQWYGNFGGEDFEVERLPLPIFGAASMCEHVS